MAGRNRSPWRSPSTAEPGQARRHRASSKQETKARSDAPIALTIAGSDCSAGAGIQADLKTFTALGVFGLTAVTCVVAEIPRRVSRIEPVTATMVREQIEVLLTNFPVGAIKTGLLGSPQVVSAVAQAIGNSGKKPGRVPLVVDPVMIATSGDNLLEPGTIESYQDKLFPLATLVTPNLDEAALLLETTIEGHKQMETAAKALARKYRVSVLLKGGHLRGANAIDVLVHDDQLTEFSAPFVRGVKTHGTGCTYSAAITAGLTRGFSLEQAIRRAKRFVTKSIERHFHWTSKSPGFLDALRQSS